MPTTNTRPPVPPFTLESATQKVRMAEDAWNSRDPEKVSLAYTVDSAEQQLALDVLESYPNCPKYIQRRQVTKDRVGNEVTTAQVFRGDALGAPQRGIINKADTFFVASAHSTRGVDASHRGGNPGFARIVDDLTLRIPDYTGNCLFNTLGNFVVNPRAGLVFVDFENGTTLQLIGRAEILWGEEDPADQSRYEIAVLHLPE